MEKLTREQVEALKAVYDRHVVPTGESSYLSFRRTACVLVYRPRRNAGGSY